MKELLTNQNIREANMINLVMSIIKSKEIIRSELAEQNGVSVMTVKKIVDELMSLGIVQETVLDSSVGRKPKALRIRDNLGVTVCVSLTSKLFFSYVLYNLYSEILEERQYKIEDQYTYRDNLSVLISLIMADVERSGMELIGVGISVPGAYYSGDDVVNYDLIPAFNDLHIRKIFFDAFQIDNIIVMHDVFVAAQAEYDLMKAKSSLFYFYVGDGVGGAFIDKDIWHTGENLVAGEVGQFIIDTEQGESTLEDCTSIPCLINKIQELYAGVSFLECLQMYDDHVPEVVRIIDEAALRISKSLYNVAWVLNPRRIVINSSYQRYAEIIAAACNEFSKRLSALPIRMDVEVVPSRLIKYGEMQGCFHLLRKHWVEGVCQL